MSTPGPAGTPGTNVVRERLPFVVIGAAIFVVLLVISAVTESNAMGSVVAVYGIVGGLLLGWLLAKAERRPGEADAPEDDI